MAGRQWNKILVSRHVNEVGTVSIWEATCVSKFVIVGRDGGRGNDHWKGDGRLYRSSLTIRPGRVIVYGTEGEAEKSWKGAEVMVHTMEVHPSLLWGECIKWISVIRLLCLQIQGWQAIVGRELYNWTSVGVGFNPWPGFPAIVQILARPPGGRLSASLSQRLTCTLQTEYHLGDKILETSLSASLWAVTQRTYSSLHSSPNARGIAGEEW